MNKSFFKRIKLIEDILCAFNDIYETHNEKAQESFLAHDFCKASVYGVRADEDRQMIYLMRCMIRSYLVDYDAKEKEIIESVLERCEKRG